MKNSEISFSDESLGLAVSGKWSIKISSGNLLSITYDNPPTSEELKTSNQIVFGNKLTVLRDKLKKL